MQAFLLGFSKDGEKALPGELPFLARMECISVEMAPASIPRGSILVCSETIPSPEKLLALIDSIGPVAVFRRMGPGRFIRLCPVDLTKSTTMEALLTHALALRDTAAGIRHDVRSPIQSIFDGAERAVQLKARESRDELLDTLGMVHSNAAIIHNALPRFRGFSEDLDRLISELSECKELPE